MNYLLIAAGTIIIIFLSWIISIKHKRYHGIARFFSFESIFLLFLLNSSVWFNNATSWFQLISWALLSFSLYFVIAGILLLLKIGKPDSNFENTSVLVRSGLYRYIRHPLYLSLFLLGTGIMFKNPGIKQIILGGINLAAVYITARIEEKEMTAKFGNEYLEYMKDTWMFIPFII